MNPEMVEARGMAQTKASPLGMSTLDLLLSFLQRDYLESYGYNNQVDKRDKKQPGASNSRTVLTRIKRKDRRCRTIGENWVETAILSEIIPSLGIPKEAYVPNRECARMFFVSLLLNAKDTF